MAVYKYKTFSEAERALWVFKPGKEYYKRLGEHFLVSEKICPPSFPRGIYKYKSFAEAQKQKMEWLIENAVKQKSRLKIKD
jgi:hypothetical protein